MDMVKDVGNLSLKREVSWVVRVDNCDVGMYDKGLGSTDDELMELSTRFESSYFRNMRSVELIVL